MPNSCLRTSSLVILLAASLGGGCVVPMPVGNGEVEVSSGADQGDDETTETSPGATSTQLTTADSGTTADSVTTGSPESGGQDDTGQDDTAGSTTGDTGVMGACPEVPGFECSMPIDCDGVPCGGVLSHFDDQGCMRARCGGPDDCGAGQTCLFSYEDYGFCTSSETTCSDGRSGACECSSTLDCGGGYCITDCHALADEASCDSAGCGFTTVVEISDTCECTQDVPLCIQGPVGLGIPSGYLWHEDTLTVAYFGPRWPSVPVGWNLCSDPGAPEACGCYDPGSEPVCP